jgi:hypothetical protein
MDKYYIAFYTSDGKDKIKGQWKLTEDEAREEANSYLYQTKLGYTLTSIASIPKATVEEMTKERNMSVGDILSCI